MLPYAFSSSEFGPVAGIEQSITFSETGRIPFFEMTILVVFGSFGQHSGLFKCVETSTPA